VSFFFKTVNLVESKNDIFICPIENNNRMSLNSSKVLKAEKKRRKAEKLRRTDMLHYRIREYFKMFTSFLNFNFETYFVVAYRDRLIKIDLTNVREYAIK